MKQGFSQARQVSIIDLALHLEVQWTDGSPESKKNSKHHTVTERNCKSCSQPVADGAKSCDNCGASLVERSRLILLAYYYFGAGLVVIGLYAYVIDFQGAKSLAIRWLAVGLSLVMIVYGRSRRHESDLAGLVYLAGLASLAMLLVVGTYLIWNQGIAIPLILNGLD